MPGQDVGELGDRPVFLKIGNRSPKDRLPCGLSAIRSHSTRAAVSASVAWSHETFSTHRTRKHVSAA